MAERVEFIRLSLLERESFSLFFVVSGPYSLNVPHGLTLAEDKKLICVADRENGRVQCFNTESGKFVKSIQPAEFGSTIYSVAYAKKTGTI